VLLHSSFLASKIYTKRPESSIVEIIETKQGIKSSNRISPTLLQQISYIEVCNPIPYIMSIYIVQYIVYSDAYAREGSKNSFRRPPIGSVS
jgi:hypothetical protein